MKQIPLTQGHFANVDDVDFEALSKFKWYMTILGGIKYAARSSRVGECSPRTVILMHRVIMGNPDTLDVDHKDRNGLNNLRSNLRVASRMKNMMNAKLRSDNTVGLKGVSFNRKKGKFISQIYVNGKHCYLGSFKTPEDAHLAYREAALKFHGEFARFE